MSIHSLRNLIIGYTITILVVLLILLYTFSTLRSQEKTLEKISQSREAMQVLGPSLVDMQELESDLIGYVNSSDKQDTNFFDSWRVGFKNDSTYYARQAAYFPNDEALAGQYKQLLAIQKQMKDYASNIIYLNKNESTDTARMELKKNTTAGIIKAYKSIINALEDNNRNIISTSYDNTIDLTRKTFAFVKAIAAILVIVLIISFIFHLRDIRNKEKAEAQLKKFNEELEKQVEEKTSEIKKNEEKLTLIYNTTSDVIFLIDVEAANRYKFNSVNNAFLLAKGLNKEQVIGKYVEDVISAPSLSEVLKNYGRAIEIHGTNTWEETSVYPSGEKTGTVTVTPVFNEKDECTMLVGAVHDITERKKTERELMEAESKFRNLVEQSLVGVYIIRNGQFAYVNPRFAKMFGYKQQELIENNPLNVIQDIDKSMVAENVRARVTGEKESVHYEAMGRSKTGETVYVEIFCSGTLYDGSSAIIGTVLDITERKKAEEEIVKANERFNLIAKATNDAVWDWDILNDSNWGNEIFYKYYGIKNGSISNNETFLVRVHPDDKERILKKLEESITNKAEQILDEFRFRMPGGEYRYFYNRAYIIYDNNDKAIRMLGSMMDITKTKLLEKEMLDQKVQEQKRIIRAVLKAEEKERNKIGQELHDNVNQILAGTKMYLSMIEKDKGEVIKGDLVKNSIELIDSAIQEIRSLSKSQVTPVKEVNLEHLIFSLVDKLNASSSLKTRIYYDVKTKVIEDDLKLNLYRIVQEQTNNILKHANASIVTISIKDDYEFLYLCIEDNGKGFDPAQKRNGIGLSNMINRVESFNGEIQIESIPGSGCKLKIKVPY